MKVVTIYRVGDAHIEVTADGKDFELMPEIGFLVCSVLEHPVTATLTKAIEPGYRYGTASWAPDVALGGMLIHIQDTDRLDKHTVLFFNRDGDEWSYTP